MSNTRLDEVTEMILYCFDFADNEGVRVDYVPLEVGKIRINHDGAAYLVTIKKER